MQISQDELLDALRDAMTPKEGDVGEGFRTVQELAAATKGTSDEKVRKGLKALSDQGRLEVRQVRRQAIDGRYTSVPAYRVRAA